MRFYLASQSPARLETLRRAGVEPAVIVSGFDEASVDAPVTADLVRLLAMSKLHAVLPRVEQPAIVLGCDSMLEFEGRPYGKPNDLDAAVARWKAMRGRSGILHTGHALSGPGFQVAETVSTVVHFADVTDDEIDSYCATGEPLAVAGAFTIDGLGGWFLDGVEGDPHNVVGLSLPALRRMLRDQGLSLTDLGYPA